MRRAPRRSGHVLAALAVVLVAGCGTTVPTAGGGLATATSGAGGAQTGLGAAGGGVLTPAAAGPQAGAADSAPGAARGGASAGDTAAGQLTTAAAGGNAGTGSTAQRGGMPLAGRGYDAKTLYLGFPTNNDVNDSAKNLGLAALNFGDIPAQIKAVVDDVNKHGGILGRKVVPVLHDIKTADLQSDPNGQAQATCSAFTEDRKVVAVVNVVAGIDVQTFYSCLAKHDTPVVSAGFTPVDDAFVASYSPYLYKLTSASFTSLIPVWIARLAAQGYFGGWNTASGGPGTGPAKIGLLYPAAQPQQRIFASLRKQLSQHGYDVVKEYQYSVASLDQESSSMASAVLAFNSAGVTHVLSSESDALLFMTAAENQHYRPRYGLTSYHAPAAALQGTVPAGQLVGSMGVGWLPVSDVDSSHSPGPVGPGETSCRRIMKDHGVDISSAGAATVAFAECDGIRLILGAVTTQQDASSRGIRAGVARTGPTFQSALVRRSGFSATSAVMPGAVRDFAYDGSAYRYTSSTDHPL